MTAIIPPYDAVCADVRDRCHGGLDGDLVLVFLDGSGDALLTLDVDEGTRHLDELFVRYVIALVGDLRLPAVVVAVFRRSGQPTRSDRWLWRELHRRGAGGGTELSDCIVVGSERWWSARGAHRSAVPCTAVRTAAGAA